jgi:transglutaminase-like putative cysteine protease
VAFEATGQPSPAAALTAAPADHSQSPPEGYEITRAVADQDMEAGDSYTVVSQYAQVTRQALENAGNNYPPAITEHYLQLPDNFSPLVAKIAISVTTGAETPYAKAKAVETYLRTYPYDDTIPAPPADKDPVEYFLFELRRGYCDYYATSMALMLRYLGIPARTASGYAEGTFDEESGTFMLTDADAHTWVEVFFPNFGWVEFEPTAGESPLNRPDALGSGPDRLDGAVTPSAAEGGAVNNPQQDGLTDPLLDQVSGPAVAQNGLSSRWWLWALLTPVLLVLGALGLRRTQFFGPLNFTPELPPILYERLQRWAERLGMHIPASHTPYEQSRSFNRALPEGQPYINEITDTYVRYRFSRHAEESNGALPGNEANPAGQRLVDAWQQLQPMLWRAWGRKVTNVRKRSENPYGLTDE